MPFTQNILIPLRPLTSFLIGEMTLVTAGKQQTYRHGERCDVPAGAVHSARMGPKGCRYLIGER